METVETTPVLTLPPNWEERQDANGRTFYVNHESRSTQWEHPAVTRARSGGGSRGSRSSAGGGRTSSSDRAAAATAAAAAASAARTVGGGGASESPASEAAESDQFNRRHHISVEDDAREEAGAAGASSVAEDTDEVVSQLQRQTTGESTAESPSSPAPSSAADSNSLPSGWSMKRAPNGRTFFIDHARKTTTWTDPRTGRPSPSASGGGGRRKSSRSSASRVGKHENGLGPLPAGWEERVHKDGRTFFIDHNNKRTTWEDPRLSDPNVSGPAVPYSR